MDEKKNKIVDLLLKGMSNREIAKVMKLAEKTIKWHLTLVYKHHNVKSRMQLSAKLNALRSK